MFANVCFQQVQNFKARAEDVIIASFPKSGTTWVQEIVHQISMIHASKQDQKDSNVVEKKVYFECQKLALIVKYETEGIEIAFNEKIFLIGSKRIINIK